MKPIFTKMVDAVEAANAAPDDYINPADGLKYCGKCHTPKEALYPTDLQAQGFTKHPVMCKCAAERREREEAERREYERMSYMTMLRSEAFHDMPAALWRFESAAVTTPQLAKARGYAQNWDEFKKAGIGLLLFGNVGTGKSYAAGCIANALIDRLESVLFVGMSDVVNRMQGNFGTDRDHYMKSLMRPDLLILDDLGAERNTSFGTCDTVLTPRKRFNWRYSHEKTNFYDYGYLSVVLLGGLRRGWRNEQQYGTFRNPIPNRKAVLRTCGRSGCFLR